MWVNREHFDRTLKDNMNKMNEIVQLNYDRIKTESVAAELRAQKVKDDITLDWMRHQVNTLSKTNAALLAKAAGIHIPVPEIVPTRPGTMTIPDFDSMPNFEDVGDDAARRLGIGHTADGMIEYGTK